MSFLKVFFPILILVFAASCNNSGQNEATGTGSSSGNFKNVVTLPSANGVVPITLSKAVRSNQDPNSLIELIGSNGEIGANCASVEACKCQFDWTESNGQVRFAEQKPALVEQNMMRCLFTQVTPNTEYYNVRILINNGGATSNSVTVYLTAINPSLDPSLDSNYVAVQRYQCRDVIDGSNNKNTLFYQGLTDPRLWDLSRAYNFYTTSLGLDYGATATTTGSATVTPTGFECPLIPNDENDHPAYVYKLFSVAPINLNNISLVDVATGDNTIYPPSDNIGLNASSCVQGTESGCEKYKVNRHDFYLSNFQDGIFKTPFCAIHKVSNFLSSGLQCKIDASKGTVTLGSAALAAEGQDIIGFAALPDSNEKCPDSNKASIPAGKKWAKVWRFRVSLLPRAINDVLNPGDIQDLFCTTRQNECVSYQTPTGATSSVCWSSVINASSGITATRIGPQVSAIQTSGKGFGNCQGASAGGVIGDNFTPTAGAYATVGQTCTTCCQDNGNGVNPAANYTLSGAFCAPTLRGSNDAENTGGKAQDVWLMSIAGSKRPCIEADTDFNGKLAMTTFPDAMQAYEVSPKYIDGNSREEFIYVVTPESITTSTMQDPENPVAKQYTPQRQLMQGDTTLITYGLEAGSLNNSNVSDRSANFPLCVLQDAK